MIYYMDFLLYLETRCSVWKGMYTSVQLYKTDILTILT